MSTTTHPLQILTPKIQSRRGRNIYRVNTQYGEWWQRAWRNEWYASSSLFIFEMLIRAHKKHPHPHCPSVHTSAGRQANQPVYSFIHPARVSKTDETVWRTLQPQRFWMTERGHGAWAVSGFTIPPSSLTSTLYHLHFVRFFFPRFESFCLWTHDRSKQSPIN